ncbi:MAG: hypothetical protein LBE92_09860 [Chryseobacterium sp.]|jgi:Na+-transporting methylmalonyl-CoA/oxaloacetate decarboxylase beta subunit|uniref:hypothetical protein n=1 Tax=Chryseobacterium sp. TaxID=1871047 RepID=UPI002823D850|nr:hypothetical protein [Chryseobacterium sp.]MDR2236419.1 hypothetical protein [Chryseobacterium sp.]
MKNRSITEYTDEELIRHEKKVQVLTIMLATSMIVLVFTFIVLMIKKGFNPVMIVPIGLFPLLVVNIINLKNLKKEKEKRGL